MDLFEINKRTCNQDGICAAVCPSEIILFQKNGYPTPAADAEERCIHCGHCVAVCPTASFIHRDMAVEDCPPIRKEFLLNEKQCEHFLRHRRSIRVYKNQPIPRENLARLIEIARYAPSGRNYQPVEWLVLGKPDELNNLSGIVVDWMRWMIDNKTEIALSLKLDKTVKRWDNGSNVILRNAAAVIVTHSKKNDQIAPVSCTIALTYLELAASSLGLGCCWAGYFNAAATTFPPMMEALALPENHQCLGAMMVGYPKFSYHRLPTRKTPNITWRMP
ncbi:MAG: 4Fe-4S dicluster domain-containing protein [Desulfobacteraceae bacterium]|nr:MAG: 4Fe-4S dicluster domain-containing protein [Desulfobacteraceae bacterium]RPH53211.1 MAG: 4Fe-4S dicluster domain-containing protein [Desulfobacteraceae bacterium]